MELKKIFIIAILSIYNIIFVCYEFLLYRDITKNSDYYTRDMLNYYIIKENKDKRYVEYITEINISSTIIQLPNKIFIYKDYNAFCNCKDKNDTNYPFYDKKLCYIFKDCSTNFFITKDNYKMSKISIWNNKTIYTNIKKYIFYQGINNYTGECDTNFNYKKCGFLKDINSNFCIKNNEPCPFNDSNIIFNLNNLTNDVILLYDDKKTKIFENFEMKDFFPDLYIKDKNKIRDYDILDVTTLYNLSIDNNLDNLKEIIKNGVKDIKIELSTLKANNNSIKLCENYLKEDKKIKTYNTKFFLISLSYGLFFLFMIMSLYLLMAQNFFFY